MGPGSRGACHRARIRATRWLGRDDRDSRSTFQTANSHPSLRGAKATKQSTCLVAPMDCFANARNDGWIRLRLPAARSAPELCENLSPRENEGAGNAGCAAGTRSLACEMEKAHEHSHRSCSRNTRHSLRNGFNGLLRTLPGDRAFLPPSPARSSPRKLDISVGMPGPHDFAVRLRAARLASPKRPPHPAPNVRDDRETPLLVRRDSAENAFDLGLRSIPSGCDKLARRANQ
jgi:hypothetical protein